MANSFFIGKPREIAARREAVADGKRLGFMGKDAGWHKASQAGPSVEPTLPQPGMKAGREDKQSTFEHTTKSPGQEVEVVS
jgi:hypothetical protein